MSATLHDKAVRHMPQENLLLAALPSRERERLAPYLHEVVLEFKQLLIEPN
jgi:hypothetical protein